MVARNLAKGVIHNTNSQVDILSCINHFIFNELYQFLHICLC